MNSSVMRFLQQENIRLKKEIESLEKEKKSLLGYLDVIRAITDNLHQVSTLDQPLELLETLLKKTRQVIGANDGSISKLIPDTKELVFLLVQGELGGQLTGFRIKSGTGIAGWVVTHKAPIIVNTPRQDWRFSQLVDEEFSFFTWSIASVPILKEGNLMGIIQLLNKHMSDFTQADVTLMTALAYLASLVIDRIELPDPPVRTHEGLLFG